MLRSFLWGVYIKNLLCTVEFHQLMVQLGRIHMGSYNQESEALIRKVYLNYWVCILMIIDCEIAVTSKPTFADWMRYWELSKFFGRKHVVKWIKERDLLSLHVFRFCIWLVSKYLQLIKFWGMIFGSDMKLLNWLKKCDKFWRGWKIRQFSSVSAL